MSEDFGFALILAVIIGGCVGDGYIDHLNKKLETEKQYRLVQKLNECKSNKNNQ